MCKGGAELATGVLWHKGHNSQLQGRIATPVNLYSSITPPETCQQVSVVCELRLKSGLVFYFLNRRKYLSIAV
jgi:hypothetical protein